MELQNAHRGTWEDNFAFNGAFQYKAGELILSTIFRPGTFLNFLNLFKFTPVFSVSSDAGIVYINLVISI